MSAATYKVHRIGLVNVSVYLIYRPGEAILVDCGTSGSEVKILEVFKGLGLEPGMLKLLILTHAHFDHAGSAGKLKELTGCPVVIHRSEADRLRKGFTPIPSGTRWKAKFLVGLGRTFARRLMKYPGAEPDLIADDLFELEPYGFPGRVIHTPGHTYGSMIILMEDGELIAGDTLFGVENKQHFPPFAEDLPALVRSWAVIRHLQVKTIYPAHGRYFPFESFLAEYDTVVERYGSDRLLRNR
ncbi:MAG: MBL fold metallo-hydrolase [Bacteroidales bacterium]|nr:MBL fold metallo-hydrolase [Bacteroidales bacterium]